MEKLRLEKEMPEARKAAILLSSMDEAAAGNLIRQLSAEQRKRMATELRNLKNVEPVEHAEVLSEFERLARDPGDDDSIEWDVSETTLVHARSEEESDESQFETAGQAEASGHAGSVDPEVIRPMLDYERPQTIAALLSLLESGTQEALLGQLSPTLQLDVRRRLIHLNPLPADVTSWLRTFLESDDDLKQPPVLVRNMDQAALQVHSGPAPKMTEFRTDDSRAAQKELPLSCGHIIESADFEILAEIKTGTLRFVLESTASEIWSVALVNASSALKLFVFQAASPEMVEAIRRDMNRIGPVRLSDVDRAQQFLLRSALEFEASRAVGTEQTPWEYPSE